MWLNECSPISWPSKWKAIASTIELPRPTRRWRDPAGGHAVRQVPAAASKTTTTIISYVGRRVSSPVLVGRGLELAELESALARAIDGDASVVFIAGEAGVGKSRLVKQFADAVAGPAGVRVWLGRCLPLSEGAPPYAPIVDVFRAAIAGLGHERVRELAGATAPRLARLLPEMGDATAAGPDVSTVDGTQARQWLDLVWLLNRLVDRPTVVVIEDVHWADPSTRGLLSLLFNGVKGPLLLVCTYRDDELPPAHETRSLLAQWYRAGVGRIAIGRLDHAGTLAQIEAITGDDPPGPDRVGELLRRSGGNPFFVEELLAADALHGQDLPEDLRDVLLLRVRQLPPAATLTVRAVAIAGHSAPHTLLAEVLGLPDGELVAALLSAVDSHILVTDADRFRFRHTLVAEAVTADMLPGERIRWHRALAEALDRRLAGSTAAGNRPVLLAETAHHWFAAGEANRALVATIEAGLAAEGVFALAEAHGHFRRALDLWHDAPDGRPLASLDLIGLCQHAAETAFFLYDLETALALVRQALGHIDEQLEPMRAGLLYALRGKSMIAGGKPIAATLEAYETAVRLVPAEPSRERAGILSSFAAAVMVSGRHEEAAVLAREAVDISRAVTSPQGAVRGLATLGNALVLLGRPEDGIAHLRESIEVATASGDPGLLVGAYINLSDALCNAGRLAEAAEVALHGLEVLRPYSFQRGHYYLLAANAHEFLFLLGRWDELADRLAEIGDNFVHPYLWVTAAAFHTAAGRSDAAELALRECRDALAGANLELAGHILACTAEWHLWRGDPRAAWDSVERCFALLGEHTSHGPLVARLLACGARAYADLAVFHRESDPEALARLRDRIDELPRALHHTSFAEAHLSLAQAELTRLHDADADAWDRAAGLWSGLEAPYATAYSRWRQAEALIHQGGKRQQAARAAAEAHATAARLGAAPLRREIEALAKRARLKPFPSSSNPDGERDEAPFGLTSREVDVLRLLAAGHTNRQIAGRLFIAEKTVNTHVSNILAKMAVPNRSAAAAAAHRFDLL